MCLRLVCSNVVPLAPYFAGVASPAVAPVQQQQQHKRRCQATCRVCWRKWMYCCHAAVPGPRTLLMQPWHWLTCKHAATAGEEQQGPQQTSKRAAVMREAQQACAWLLAVSHIGAAHLWVVSEPAGTSWKLAVSTGTIHWRHRPRPHRMSGHIVGSAEGAWQC